MKVHKDEMNLFREYSITTTVINFNNKESELRVYPYIKRIFDIFFSIVGILLTTPIVILFAILIKIETPGPMFFLQERVGLNGKYFNVIKLRSMVVDAEKNGAKWADKNDPRITKVGVFIRKTRIDELPQLLNILKGEMSLVGPRPERPEFTAQFNKRIPGFVERIKVLPGLTGWAQVNGGYEITPEEKLKLDLYYINNKNVWLDIKILFKTIKICVTGVGAR